MNPTVKVGDEIKIIKMVGEPNYTGRQGIIEYIDGMGQLHGDWGGLAIIPEKDKFKIIEDKNSRHA